LRSVLIRPPVVLGQQMLPFSAYHMAALMLIDSPYAPTAPQPKVSRQDLAVAAFVCAHGFEDGPGLMFPDLNEDEFCKFCDPDADFEYENAQFQTYITDYCTVPEIWTPVDTSATKTTGIPVPFHLVGVVLQAFSGITRAEAWNMGIGELIGYKVSVAEENGADVKSQRDYELLEFKRQIEAQAKANNGTA